MGSLVSISVGRTRFFFSFFSVFSSRIRFSFMCVCALGCIQCETYNFHKFDYKTYCAIKLICNNLQMHSALSYVIVTFAFSFVFYLFFFARSLLSPFQLHCGDVFDSVISLMANRFYSFKYTMGPWSSVEYASRLQHHTRHMN